MRARARILIYKYITAVFLLCCAFANAFTLSTDRSFPSYRWTSNVNGVEDKRQIKWAPVAHPPNSTRHIPTSQSGEPYIEKERIWGTQPHPTKIDVEMRILLQTYPHTTPRHNVFLIKN